MIYGHFVCVWDQFSWYESQCENRYVSSHAKEVQYQEQLAHCRSMTVDYIKCIMNIKYATSNGRVLLDRLGLNQVYWLKKTSPDPGSAIWCASRVGLGIFHFLWSIVFEIIIAVDWIWDAGDQKKKLWGQKALSNAAAFYSSNPQLWGPSGKKTLKKTVQFPRLLSWTPICDWKRHLAQHKKRGGNIPCS